MIRVLVLVVMFGGCLACASDDGLRGDMEPVVTVENGVTMVSNPGLEMADSLAIVIDTVPVTRIGVVRGPEDYMIGRLGGMLRRSDGSIVIADAASHQVKVYDESGQFVRVAGGAGEGPGEYNWLTHVLPHSADSVVIMDHEGSRASVVDASLTFNRRYRVLLNETRATYPMTSHRLVGFFDDGTLLVSDYLNVCGANRSEGFCEDSVAFYRVEEDGTVRSRFGKFVYSRSESRRGEVNVGIREPHPQAFWTVKGSRFYYADASRFEVRVFLSDGTLERVISLATQIPQYDRSEVFPPRAASGGDQDAKTQKAMLALDQMFAEIPLPSSFPAFSDMLIDDAARVWVREYLPSARLRDTSPRWFVFDADGRLLYSVRSPPYMMRTRQTYTTLHPQIGTDFILTSARDQDGVESVVLYKYSIR
jgi:hypothetical protein